MSKIIEVKNISKKYKLGQNKAGYLTLRDVLVDAFKSPKNIFKRKKSKDDFWALKDISFSVEKGEAIGIIGANGAGKSTLLKILSQITPPTEGEIIMRGRVASLLEVGTGFHPELTGRENIYLNGSILGMSKKEIEKKFDEIVEFSGVEKFLDTPVKRYSSGMKVRLAFSVAAHLEPEILIVDEVLAVGDAEFQKKCLGKMKDVTTGGRTILFVSHNMGAVQNLCDRCILLNDGKTAMNGKTSDVISEYFINSRKSVIRKKEISSKYFKGTLKESVLFKRIIINNISLEDEFIFSPKQDLVFEIFGESLEEIKNFRTTFSIFKEGARLFSLHDTQEQVDLRRGKFCSVFRIPAYFLRPGEHFIALGGYTEGASDWIWGLDLVNFTIKEEWSERCDSKNFGIINLPTKGKRIIK